MLIYHGIFFSDRKTDREEGAVLVEMGLLVLTLAFRKFNAKVRHVYIQMPTTFDSYPREWCWRPFGMTKLVGSVRQKIRDFNVVICGDKFNNLWRIITRNGRQNEIAGER